MPQEYGIVHVVCPQGIRKKDGGDEAELALLLALCRAWGCEEGEAAGCGYLNPALTHRANFMSPRWGSWIDRASWAGIDGVDGRGWVRRAD